MHIITITLLYDYSSCLGVARNSSKWFHYLYVSQSLLLFTNVFICVDYIKTSSKYSREYHGLKLRTTRNFSPNTETMINELIMLLLSFDGASDEPTSNNKSVDWLIVTAETSSFSERPDLLESTLLFLSHLPELLAMGEQLFSLITYKNSMFIVILTVVWYIMGVRIMKMFLLPRCCSPCRSILIAKTHGFF